MKFLSVINACGKFKSYNFSENFKIEKNKLTEKYTGTKNLTNATETVCFCSIDFFPLECCKK